MNIRFDIMLTCMGNKPQSLLSISDMLSVIANDLSTSMNAL